MYRHDWMDKSKLYNIKHSQNFIKSKAIASEVVNLARIDKNDLVVEIGPGEGSLTEFIVQKSAKVIAVEKDEVLAEKLKRKFLVNLTHGNSRPQSDNSLKVEIITADFLTFQLPEQEYKIIGNIPFALTSRIIKKLLDDQNPPEEAFLILQKEAAMRFLINELLSLKYLPWFDFEILKTFKPEDFYPIPSVLPVLFKIKKLNYPLIPEEKHLQYRSFLTYCFLNSKFGLKSSFKKLFTFKQIGIISRKHNLQRKPSEVSLVEWIEIFNEFQKYGLEDKKQLVEAFAKKFEQEITPGEKIYRSRTIYPRV